MSQRPVALIYNEPFNDLIVSDALTITNLSEEATRSYDFSKPIFVIYLSIVIIFLFRCLISVLSTVRIIHKGILKDSRFPRVVLTDQKLSPFSFFPYVVIPSDFINNVNYTDVLNHEIAHVKQGHTFDLLLSEIISSLQWFNPFVWFIKRSIVLNHEYLADYASISRQSDKKEYQMGLLRLSTGFDAVPLAHNFNSVVKNRIIMINKKPSARLSATKNLILIPVAAFIIYTSATPESKVSSSSVPLKADQELRDQARGMVVGEDGKPLRLVLVTMRSNTPETIGVQTGSDGRFIINNLVKDAALEFSCIGYKTQIVKPDYTADMVVRMVKDPNYKMTVATADASFYHEGTNVRIVLTQNKDAIVVVDEKITDNRGGITMNREEIADSKLLKGDDAVNKYGDKGKNGVLEIITKKYAQEKGIKIPEITMSSNSPGDAPTFQGQDRSAFQNWVLKNVNYPSEALRKGIEGWVSVNFTVNPDGSVSNVTSVIPVDKQLGDEVIRVVKSSKWDPARNMSTAKPFNHTVTMKFASGTKSGDVPVIKVDEMPDYPGGEEALIGFINSNIRYPKEAVSGKIQGRVILRFIVTREGNSEGISVVKGVHPLLDAEAVRVVGLLKNWEPGKLNGKTVNVWYTLPVTFQLY